MTKINFAAYYQTNSMIAISAASPRRGPVLMKVRNLGRKSLEEVINKLESLGYGLREEDE